jgi:hypothetical protein
MLKIFRLHRVVLILAIVLQSVSTCRPADRVGVRGSAPDVSPLHQQALVPHLVAAFRRPFDLLAAHLAQWIPRWQPADGILDPDILRSPLLREIEEQGGTRTYPGARKSRQLKGPTRNIFWNYWIRLKGATKIPSHGKALSLAGGGAVSSVLYGTNADEIVLIDRAPWIGNIPATEIIDRNFEMTEDEAGFQLGGEVHAAGLHASLEHDLARLGIPREQVTPRGLIDGAWTFQFLWAYPREKPVLRTVYVYADWDLLERPTVPAKAKGADIIWQKASFDLPHQYGAYMPRFIDVASAKVWIVTDDRDNSARLVPLDAQLPDYDFRPIHTARVTLPKLLPLQRELVEDHYIRPAAEKGYGWDMNVRQRVPPSDAASFKRSPRLRYQLHFRTAA